MFSICLCSWNDLKFLKILHAGITRNTKVPYELIVHDNGSEDGTEDWLKESGIKYSRSDTNLGVAAVNFAVEMATYPYIIDINADMYPLPGWDMEIFKQINEFRRQGIEKYTISSCLIEPVGANPEYTIRNHGTNPETFKEDDLLKDYFTNSTTYAKMNTTQYSHPVGMPKALWDEMRGVDMDYFPGYASDHDIAARAHAAGCRNFIMLGKSRVYHFIGQTLKKLPDDLKSRHGHDIFKNKWGMTVEEFRKKMRIGEAYESR